MFMRTSIWKCQSGLWATLIWMEILLALIRKVIMRLWLRLLEEIIWKYILRMWRAVNRGTFNHLFKKILNNYKNLILLCSLLPALKKKRNRLRSKILRRKFLKNYRMLVNLLFKLKIKNNLKTMANVTWKIHIAKLGKRKCNRKWQSL